MAAATTYTYTLYDPNDDIMNGNLQFYMEHENVTDDMFKDLDVSPVVDFYYDGMYIHGMRIGGGGGGATESRFSLFLV